MNKRETTQLRLAAREQKLQARADWHLEQVKTNMDYLRTDGLRLIGKDVADNVAPQSPVIAKVINYLTGNKKDTPEPKKGLFGRTIGAPSNYGNRQTTTNANPFSLEGLKATILPTLYTLGSMKLMSYSLKGTRSLAQAGLKRLFGFGRKKK